jgi:hypothetical protein
MTIAAPSVDLLAFTGPPGDLVAFAGPPHEQASPCKTLSTAATAAAAAVRQDTTFSNDNGSTSSGFAGPRRPSRGFVGLCWPPGSEPPPARLFQQQQQQQPLHQDSSETLQSEAAPPVDFSAFAGLLGIHWPLLASP